MIEYCNHQVREMIITMPEDGDTWRPVPQLMTQNELVRFLRIPEISTAKNQNNVIEHLKRFRNLPRIHLCNKTLYPLNAVIAWIEKETINGN